MNKKIKIMNIKDENGYTNMLVLENEVFDWGIDPKSLKEAKKMIKQRPDMREQVSMSIINHFVDCFSEFCDTKLSLKDILIAIERGDL